MNATIDRFLHTVAYSIDDEPMTQSVAEDLIHRWENLGVDIPDDVSVVSLTAHCLDVLRSRYPVAAERIDPKLDRAVTEWLDGEGWDFIDGLDDPIDYVSAWYAVEEWRDVVRQDGNEFPDFLTPLTFMRYVNYHHEQRVMRDVLWLVTFENYEEHWHGPYCSIRPDHANADGSVVYDASDSCGFEYHLTVPKWHEIMSHD